jgi:hypothetical protein
MGKKRVIKISESQFERVVKGLLKEQGGYDDIGVMVQHGGSLLSGVNAALMSLVDRMNTVHDYYTSDEAMNKGILMKLIPYFYEEAERVASFMKAMTPEVTERDLRKTLTTFSRKLNKYVNTLRLLSREDLSHINPREPRRMQMGVGSSMSHDELTNKFLKIVSDIGLEAVKTKENLDQVTKRMGGWIERGLN